MITVQVALALVTHGTELVQILQSIIVIGSITVVNLGHAQSPGRSLVVNGTLETQMPVLITTSACAVGPDSGSIGLTSITGLLTVAAYRAQSHTVMSHGLFTSVIDTPRSGLFLSH
jgi:hypothetical protein